MERWQAELGPYAEWQVWSHQLAKRTFGLERRIVDFGPEPTFVPGAEDNRTEAFRDNLRKTPDDTNCRKPFFAALDQIVVVTPPLERGVDTNFRNPLPFQIWLAEVSQNYGNEEVCK